MPNMIKTCHPQNLQMKAIFTIIAALMMMVAFHSYAQASEKTTALISPADDSTEDVVDISFAWAADKARPGDAIVLAVVLDIKQTYHINADQSQARALADFKPYPTRVRIIEAPPGIIAGTARFPQAHPQKVDFAAGDIEVFDGRTVVYLPLRLDEQMGPGRAPLKINVAYQACGTNFCLLPQETTLDTYLEVATLQSDIKQINKSLFLNYSEISMQEISKGVRFDLFGLSFTVDISSGFGLVAILLTAALGGFLLNLTPCVLPLIPIKVISLSQAAKNRKRCFSLGAATFFGIAVFWLGLGLMIASISGFTATSQLFHYPAFTIIVGFIIAIMGIGMFGAYAVRLPNFVYAFNPGQESLHGSFGLGILTAVLSTPCTAPFMGAAAAWAATQSPATTLSTFFAIGVGMGLPYLVLSAFPALVDRVPKTGPASELIKQVMGLFLLAAAAYFLGIGLTSLFSSPPDPPPRIYWWPVMGFCAAAGAWLTYRTLQIASNKKAKMIFSVLGLMLITFSLLGAVRLTADGSIDWVYYTPQKFEAVKGENNVVVMVFTAEWCLNCKALEQGVFTNPEIVKLLASQAVVPIKVDLTGRNPSGRAKLRETGTLTIPLLVIYSGDGRQIFKSDFYTAGQVVKAIEDALGEDNSL